MAPRRSLWIRTLGLVLAAACLAGPAQAGEVDRYLPDDTEVVVTLNVRQVLDSNLVKKFGLDQLREAIKANDEVNAVLKDLGFDPLKDVERVIVASPGGTDQDKGLVIVHGKYDLAKFKAKGEESAKDYGDIVKIHKVKSGRDEFIIYEVILPDQGQSLFVALPTDSTLLLSGGKDYVVDALKKTGRKGKPTLKNKDFQAVLERLNAKQSLSLVALGSALRKGGLAETPAKDVLERIDALGGGITISDDVKMEVVIGAKNADDAKLIHRKLTDGINQAVGVLALLAGAQPELTPVVEVLKTLTTTTKDKTITIKGQISADVIQKALDKDK